MAARIGIDTGGTFTDVVRWSRTGVEVHKLPSTPPDPARAVLDGLAAVRRSPREEVDVVHGTTVGLNAVLTGDVARTAFVTNRGFEDLIEIGRQERTDLYALEPDRPSPPVPRALRLGVDCRRGPGGEVERPLTGAAIARAVAALRRLRPEAVAIGFLHSPAAPADERRLARAVRAALPGVPVTCSAELWPAFGEYERFTAAILNAAIAPKVGGYVQRLARAAAPGRLRLLRSSLGIVAAEEVAAFPARALFSGPAGGVLATAAVAKAEGFSRAAAFDMGGTSTDVCLVGASAEAANERTIGGLPLALPAVPVHTVGCGGGSVAWTDAGGALRVGPHSAGADPGPACYGRGGEATVTDAHVALGHLGESTLLGGAFPVDVAAGVRAIEKLARRLGLSPRRCAEGILEVAETAMARALMVITVERAVDPAEVPLVAYGGAGGLHAAGLAARLGMPRALVPALPGAFSALGLALAGESAERTIAVRRTWSPATERELRDEGEALVRAARADLDRATRDGGAVARSRGACDAVVRFAGQGGGLRLPLGRGALRDRFLAAHGRLFGFAPPATPIEVVRLEARAERAARNLPRPRQGPRGGAAAPRLRRPPLGGAAIRVHARDELAYGISLRGPCVVEERTGTTLVPPGGALLVTPRALVLRARPNARS